MTSLVGRVQRDFAAAEARRELLERQDPARVAERQLAAMQAVWSDAVADVPYYASLVAQRRAPAAIRSWDDVRAIPELRREAFRDDPAAFIRLSGAPPGFVTTGGSTGTPIKMGMTPEERRLMRTVKLTAWQSAGYTPASRIFLIWGHSHLLGTGWRGRLNHARRKLTDAVLNYRRVDAYRLSPEICRDYADEILRFRPFGIIGYASALDLFARHTRAYRDRFRALGLGFVLATSEAPPREDSVALLEDLFGCPLVQEYGGAEFGQVAFKRGSLPFEVYSDLTYLECQEGSGSALVSALYPRYTPLIRYQVGDALEAPERSAHGHVLRFNGVAGRVNDMVQLGDGSSVHSVAVMHCVHQEPAVHKVQLVMEDRGPELHLVAAPGDHSAMEQRIRGRLAQLHASLAGAPIRYVADVATTVAGKRRWFVDRRSNR